MWNLGSRSNCRRLGAVAAAALVIACGGPPEAHTTEAQPAAASEAMGVIDHVLPERDSVGSAPSHFEWTAAPDADRYAIGVWNEVDVLQWRDDRLATNSADMPEDVQLQPGTYFWEVAALRRGRQIAASGRSAFVVRDDGSQR